MINLKPTKLPSRRLLIDLGKSQQRLMDYAKLTPSNPVEAPPVLMQLLKNAKEK